MEKYVYKGVERYNQLKYGHGTPSGIVSAIDDGDTLTIFTSDMASIQSQLKQKDAEIAELKDLLREACERLGKSEEWIKGNEKKVLGYFLAKGGNPGFLNNPKLKQYIGGDDE